MKITLLLFLTLTLIFLPGCVPAPSDPYTLISAGESMLKGTQAAATQTAEGVIRENQAAVLAQMQTQASHDNAVTATNAALYSNATATALFYDSQATQAAATSQAIATQEAQIAAATRQAVELAQMQAGATATQQAALAIADAEAARLAREKVVTVFVWVGVFGTAILVLFLAAEFTRMFTRSYGKQKSWVSGAESFIMDTDRGPVIVTPRRMFSPAMQIEAKTQAVTAPQLAAPELQTLATYGALAVEFQREVSKRIQLFTQAARAQGLTEINSPAPQLPMPNLAPLPMMTGRHVLIAGPTGTGKSHTARYLLQARNHAYILDPHHTPGEWPGHCTVLGGGRDFDSIARAIKQIVGIMDSRFKQRDAGASHFDEVHLVTDEVPAIVAHVADAAKDLMEIAREGRKVRVYLMLLSQSVLVRDLGIEGHGDLRENFATIKIAALTPGTPEDTPRTVTLIVGSLVKPESQENYIVPPLPGYVPNGPNHVPEGIFDVPQLAGNGTGTRSEAMGTPFPGGNPPEKGSQAEAALVRALAGGGYGQDKIAHLLGGRRKDTLERVRAILGQMAGSMV